MLYGIYGLTAFALIAIAFLDSAIAGGAEAGPIVDRTVVASSNPVLDWHQTARETISAAKPGQHAAMRALIYLSLAQYRTLTNAARSDEAAIDHALAVASLNTLAGLLPKQVPLAEAARLRIGSAQASAGALTAGERGVESARVILAAAQEDRFQQAWTGSVPAGGDKWRSLTQPPGLPVLPLLGSMRTFILDSGQALRPAAPPALGSPQFGEALAEVRRFAQAPSAETLRIARAYDMSTGSLVAGFWNETADRLVRRDRFDRLASARVMAIMHMAIMDAAIACHDAKYAYWLPRPSQIDPSIEPVIGVPNHPSYPSNHSCISTAAASTLAHFFPADRAALEGIAAEAGMSRIYAGLHYRFDVEAGEQIGRQVGRLAIERAPQRLAQWEAPASVVLRTW